MITLFGFGPNLGVADPSPFVLKVITYLKMAGLPYQSVTDTNNLRKAPKGKLPFIEDDGETIADSYFILKHLQQKYKVELNSHLSEEQKAIADLIIKSLDENFYWCIVYSRWLSDDSWPIIKKTFFDALPFPLKHLVPVLARRNIKAAFYHHGMGRHTHAEIMEIAKETLQNLSTLLSDKTYFFGNKPSTLDAVAYAFLAQVTIASLDNELSQTAQQFPNLKTYCQHITQHYFSE